MEKHDYWAALVIGILSALISIFIKIDYSPLASSGLTLSSIVLAVYVAAIIGLVNTTLSQKMQKTISNSHTDKTQMGVLTSYLKKAISLSIGTIIISSLFLLFKDCGKGSYELIRRIMSVLGIVFYSENLLFLWMIIRFMLNRQIWNE